MDKVKIAFIEDLHGLREFYGWQIDQLKELNPQAVCLEMLPGEERFKELCAEFSAGRISLSEFRKQTRWEKHWGTFEGYDSLFKYLYSSQILLYPIDHTLRERRNLARREKQIIKNSQAGKDVQALINQSRVELFLIREAAFSQNILDLARTEKPEKIAVLVGGNHTKRLCHFFNFLDEFEAEERKLPKEKREELYPRFDKVHLKFAERENILGMENPPLVTVNALRFATRLKPVRNSTRITLAAGLQVMRQRPDP